MGNSVSISFKTDGMESVTLFSHWEGENLVKAAIRYGEELCTKVNNGAYPCLPLGRLEASTVVLDFIRHLIQHERLEVISSNFYLGVDQDDGDNGYNGHFIVEFYFYEYSSKYKCRLIRP